MAYIKYKEITKYFNFSRALDKKELPKYIKDYVFDDEKILAAYKTLTDHGVFSDKKVVLFDSFGFKRQIYMIPYKSVSTCSIIFSHSGAELLLYLDCGYPVRLKFVNMSDVDKLRVRVLYSTIIRIVNNQKLDLNDVDRLIEDKFSFNDKK